MTETLKDLLPKGRNSSQSNSNPLNCGRDGKERVHFVHYVTLTLTDLYFVGKNSVMIVMNMITWEVTDIVEVESGFLMITVVYIVIMILVINVAQTEITFKKGQNSSNNQKQNFWAKLKQGDPWVNLWSHSYVQSCHQIIQYHIL